MSKQTFSEVLREAERAWDSQDFEELERVSRRVPEGYSLLIFKRAEGSPCFDICSAEELQHLPEGFRCVEVNKPVVQGAPEQGPEASNEPDRSPGEVGVRSDLEPNEQDDRGNF